MFLRPFRRLRKSVGFRVTLWYSTLFVLSSLLLFVVAYLLLSSSVRKKDREMIRLEIDEYTLQYKMDGLEAVMDEIRRKRSSDEQAGFLVRVVDSHNRTLLLISPPRWKGLNLRGVEARSTNDKDQWTLLQKEGEDILEIATRRLPGGYALQVGRSLEERSKFLKRFWEIFIGIMIPVILVGFAGGSFLAFRALQPIRDLVQTVRSVDMGKMDARVPSPQTGDELDELVHIFNSMLERIQTLIVGMRAALDNVAHDLRTPMTRMRGVVETTLQSECDETALREALMDCAEESERIATMLNTLMDISEAETGMMELDLRKVNLVSLIEEMVELYRYVAEDKGICMAFELPERLYARADPSRIRQVVANLLDNAVKYTPGDGRVKIEACRKSDGTMISIQDTGVGIPPHDLPKIFDRLYRGDKNRSQRGLGLGLSLVRAVMHAHRGRIEVESHPGQGSQFTLFLPADPEVP